MSTEPLRLPSPPRFDSNALRGWLGIVGDPRPLIRGGLPMIPAPEWSDGEQDLRAMFGLDRPEHCFRVRPHDWARFHEPQITSGFVHFLNHGSPRRRLARAIAFVGAAATCVGKDAAAIHAFGATSARCVAEENRTDILVELRRSNDCIGASVEAKFGHRLTAGQLPKAIRTIRGRGADPSRFALLVVAPDEDALDGRVFRQNLRFGWRGTSWWMLLDQLERFTSPDDDCLDYRRFRRTVWHRAS